MPENLILAGRSLSPTSGLLDTEHPDWAGATSVSLSRDWRGGSAGSPWSQTEIRALWNRDGLLFRYECPFETLHVKKEFGADRPAENLWDFDVVEFFLRPPATQGYFEVQLSPLGQWFELHVLEPRKETDPSWRSEMDRRNILNRRQQDWRGVLELPFGPMGCAGAPAHGDSWRVNFYRIGGAEPDRLYLSWRPTGTGAPDFHVPAAFGHLIFTKENR